VRPRAPTIRSKLASNDSAIPDDDLRCESGGAGYEPLATLSRGSRWSEPETVRPAPAPSAEPHTRATKPRARQLTLATGYLLPSCPVPAPV
jgi:hypothetical protein